MPVSVHTPPTFATSSLPYRAASQRQLLPLSSTKRSKLGSQSCASTSAHAPCARACVHVCACVCVHARMCVWVYALAKSELASEFAGARQSWVHCSASQQDQRGCVCVCVCVHVNDWTFQLPIIIPALRGWQLNFCWSFSIRIPTLCFSFWDFLYTWS